MKRIAIPCLFISCFFCFSLNAQKVKDKRVDIKYVALPIEKLPSDFTTYSVRVFGGNVSTGGLISSALENSVKMDGFKRVGTGPSEFGHLRISIHTGYMSNDRPEFKSQTTTSKNDKGVETKTTTYWYSIACSSSTSYQITDPDGVVLASGSNQHAETIKSATYASSASLSKNYSSIVSGIRRNFAKSVAYSAVSIAAQALRNKFDFSNAVDDPQMYMVKKHPEEEAFETNLEKTIALFKTYSATTSSADILKDMKPVMDFWKKYADQNPGTDKDLKEIYIACNSNLAVISFYTDQFEEAEKYAGRVLKADDKEKRTIRFMEYMSKFKVRMDALGIHTTHFLRDLTKAIPPSKVKQLEEEKEQLTEDNNALTGYAVIKGDSIFGTFVRVKEQTEFIFGPAGNTKFMVETSDALVEQDLTNGEVSSFMIGERNFRKIPFSPSAKGKTEASPRILEEVYTSDKIKLFKYYPVTNALSNEQSEFAFQKKGEAQPVSLMDTRFLLLDKGLGEYFSDCADLKSLCQSSQFKLTAEDLIRAARVYAEVCQ